jgi:hypothetical protein
MHERGGSASMLLSWSCLRTYQIVDVSSGSSSFSSRTRHVNGRNDIFAASLMDSLANTTHMYFIFAVLAMNSQDDGEDI